MSQRRTREWARFQCVVHRRWRGDDTLGLIEVDVAAGVGVERLDLAEISRLVGLHDVFGFEVLALEPAILRPQRCVP